MRGLIPFNRGEKRLVETGLGDFYNMLDDFFGDHRLPERSLLRDTFKIDVKESDQDYSIEAELPGIKKDEIEINVTGEDLCIAVKREESSNTEKENYLHRERRFTSMARRVRLANASLDKTRAKLEDGVLFITVPKREKECESCKIDIE